MTERALKRMIGFLLVTALGWPLLGGSALAQEKKESPVTSILQSLKLSGYVQAYGAVWDKDTDTFLLRRARATLAGEILKNLRFKLTVDVAKSQPLLDAEIEFAPSTTCSFVTMWPAVSITKPVPSASALPPLPPPPNGTCELPEPEVVTSTSTTPGEASWAISAIDFGPLVLAVLVIVGVGVDVTVVVTAWVVLDVRCAPRP